MYFKIRLCCCAYIGEEIGWLLLTAFFFFFTLSTICTLKAKPVINIRVYNAKFRGSHLKSA